MKLRIGKDEVCFYPDVMICFDPSDQQSEQFLVKNIPKLIIEILSPSTETHDHDKQFMLYRFTLLFGQRVTAHLYPSRMFAQKDLQSL